MGAKQLYDSMPGLTVILIDPSCQYPQRLQYAYHSHALEDVRGKLGQIASLAFGQHDMRGKLVAAEALGRNRQPV
jgi:hypothetical protein